MNQTETTETIETLEQAQSFWNQHAGLLLDSAHGIHIPQIFGQEFLPCNIPAETMERLADGPEQEHYWETWQEVLDSWVGPNGETLYQDGDLWALDANFQTVADPHNLLFPC